MRPKYLLLSLSLTLVSGCVSIPNGTACSVAGTLTAGGICAETLTGKTSDKNFDEMIAWLEADETTGRAPALCMSAIDWNAMKTALEQACRELGSRCNKEAVEALLKFKLQ